MQTNIEHKREPKTRGSTTPTTKCWMFWKVAESFGCFGQSLEFFDVLGSCWKFWIFWAFERRLGFFGWSLEVLNVLGFRKMFLMFKVVSGCFYVLGGRWMFWAVAALIFFRNYQVKVEVLPSTPLSHFFIIFCP